ncbi:MAG: ParB N-terminal domain-containing protein, partial [Proteobacteria bacterium]|nr:ParB N-terminal domain-containing protein [Pseudomonadota bacterium]
MKIEQVDPCAVSIPRRLRAPDPAKTKRIGESMAAMGLQQPITVWSPKDGDCELIAGAHRLQAAVDLGWDWIDVVFHDDWSEIDRQLWEIDENLVRAELTTVERDDHLVRREELWVAHQSAQVGPVESKRADGRGHRSEGFASETAAATGLSKATINRALSRAKAIPSDIRDQIKRT